MKGLNPDLDLQEEKNILRSSRQCCGSLSNRILLNFSFGSKESGNAFSLMCLALDFGFEKNHD